MSSAHLHPAWSLVLPLLVLTAFLASPPERWLAAALVSASVFLLMQWTLPAARFRTGHYFSPLNIALALLLIKLVLTPVLLMTMGNENRILALPASVAAMNGAILIDTVAYVGFCLGLQFAPAYRPSARRFSLLPILSESPHRAFVIAFAGIGLLGLFLTFGSLAGFLEYFSEPALLQPEPETWSAFFGTVLRPFLAFALATWWARVADQSRATGSGWRPVLVGLIAAVGITVANLTFGFNRGAFVFPILSLIAVYSARIRRIPPLASFGALACFVPLLLFLGEYRSTPPPGQPAKSTGLEVSLTDLSENIQVYAGGPQLTGVFYESLGWGERLHAGHMLLSSLLSPIPILGKGFRETSAPVVYNQAIYGMAGFNDQIPPFPSELFANFHVIGVLAGFVAFGMALARSQAWLDAVGSTFGAFIIQYVATWGAMLCVWSLSVYVQILFYFLGPVYLYFAVTQTREWLRRSAGRGVHFHKGAIVQ